MRLREFTKSIGGLVGALVCCSPSGIAKHYRAAVLHATGENARWIGGSGCWSDWHNWDTGRVPGGNTDVLIDNSGQCGQLTITLDGHENSCCGLTLDGNICFDSAGAIMCDLTVGQAFVMATKLEMDAANYRKSLGRT